MDNTVNPEDINSVDPTNTTPVAPVGPVTGPIQKVEEVKEAAPVQVKKEGFFSRLNLLRCVNSPWLLILIPVLVGGFWLVLNPWVIMNNLDKPYLMMVIPAAVGSIVAGSIILKFFTAILSACKSALMAAKRAQQEDGSAQFFWIVIFVFMVVSVFASGTFFSTIEHNALPGLGYVTALFIDLVAVQAMRARLNAVRMRDKKGSNLYLFGVLLCAGASAFANVYTSLADFNQTQTGALPDWMLLIAPWFGLVFPALILLLSMTADYTLDQISTKLDPEQYRAQELKRIKLLEYQRDGMKERVLLEREIDSYTAQLQGKKEKRVFFLIAWLFPLKPLDTNAVAENVVGRVNGQIEDIVKNTYGSSFQMVLAQNMDLRQQVMTLSQRITTMDTQKDEDLYLVSREIEEAKSQAIDASVSRLHQEKEGMVSAVILEVLGRTNIGHDTDKLGTPNKSDQATDTQTNQVADNAANKEKKAPAPKDYSSESPDTFEGLDEATKTVLRDYPFLLSEYTRGVRSLSIPEIVKATGHTPQLINARKRDGVLIQTKRKGFYSIASVMNWLKGVDVPAPKDTTVLAESVPTIPGAQEQNTPEVFEAATPRITGQLWTHDPDEILGDLGEMVIAE